MNTTNFYTDLKTLESFSDITENALFNKTPNDWQILLTDIKGSTKAIEEGRYKEINMIGALAIVGILNIDKSIDFPFIFGGDGASILIPPILLERAKKVLLDTKIQAKEAYNLELRIASIPVEKITNLGYEIEIAKVAISKKYSQAVIKGGGLERAEELLKDKNQNFEIVESKERYESDFSGLECRWENIPSPKDEVISILIKSLEQNSNEIYREVLEKIDKIVGSKSERNPIKPNKLKLSFKPKVLNTEASLTTKNNFLKPFIVVKLMFLNLIGKILMDRKIGNWRIYKNIIKESTDTEKFDDMLRMVITSHKNESKKLENYFESLYQSKKIVYGIHRSDSSLMTCLIFERFGKHIHFVDGSNGGYAVASKGLKRRMEIESRKI